MYSALALSEGFLVVALIGLFFWNLYLLNKLRAVRGTESGNFPPVPVPPVPLTEVSAVMEPAVAAKAEEPVNQPDACEREWQLRIAQAEHQHQLVQGELASLSYSVSHDLRAPLRAIDGFSQALAEDYGHALDTTAQGYLQRVRANTRHMASLIEDLLSLSRLARAPMRREVVELGPLAESIMAGLRKAEPERVVTLEIQPGLCGFADRDLLEAILRHLLGNAWKFTSRRPSAHISLRSSTDQRESGKREIIYEVRDDGAGFDMNYAGKLFGAFQRMHSNEEFPGNGIGLAAVQRIVRRHAGRVWAEAAPDGGAALFFTLGSWEECGGGLVHDLTGRAGPVEEPLVQATPVSLTSSSAL